MRNLTETALKKIKIISNYMLKNENTLNLNFHIRAKQKIFCMNVAILVMKL